MKGVTKENRKLLEQEYVIGKRGKFPKFDNRPVPYKRTGRKIS